jgi:2-polyprenyl-3-methyl-5-hydroxy-6-metoxy-1,4-benzoquinol methylase
MSLRLLGEAGMGPDASVIDVGGGASFLVDRLLERGVRDVTVLDVADRALQVSRDRLGQAGKRVIWLAQDLLEWRPSRRYDLWHDRALFHFLTDPADRGRYAAVLDEALSPDGHVVIATFAEDGPEYCSGLPVARYNASDLAKALPGLHPFRAGREEHPTPSGVIQPFTWLMLSRRG